MDTGKPAIAGQAKPVHDPLIMMDENPRRLPAEESEIYRGKCWWGTLMVKAFASFSKAQIAGAVIEPIAQQCCSA